MPCFESWNWTSCTFHALASDASAELGEASPQAVRGGCGGFRVLLVEDSAPVAEIFAMILQEMEHEVEVVSSGEEALERIPAYRPQIVFSDISMPRMSGYELARRIREQADLGDLVLVAMTGYGQQEDRDRALQAGFDHHLVKPAEIEQLQALFEAISDSCGRQRPA